MTATKKPGRLGKAIVETAEDRYDAGLIDAATVEMIAIRNPGEK